MKKLVSFLFLIFFVSVSFAQKDSLQIGDKYADDQIYASISYAQFFKQPTTISKSGFSFGVSTGFIKDIILNKQGTISIGVGVGYGYDYFNHNLKVQEINNTTIFIESNTNINSNIFSSHNIEFPLEFRWRTSNAVKFDFWRIYTGVKFLYNFSNTFRFDENGTQFSYKNVSAYNNFQYGLTFSAGYDVINLHVFYNLTPIFKNATINSEPIDTSILKFGLIFYIL
ncbi:porin family protein [Polaribacter gangjinensis]|uniref:Outer membrane protein beta-barrel domain-containing protein n=1 Tax=Polaribacter gangjinensis TaxID=574710 RepID=A0A2S7WEE6_9FLAO|nr:porin family protein [Polaribacter gangjinensis]PQJ75786.1 hypothetical protein BTO13_11375 [Polaribacter gangjinensis]